MALEILARKIGMTQVFVDDRAVGATVIEAEPCRVVQIKTEDTDGYNAVQIGYDELPDRKTNRPMKGHFDKAGVPAFRHLFEVRVADPSEYNIGDSVGVSIFAEGQKIDVTSRSAWFNMRLIM